MGFIIIAPFAILAGWLIYTICRWLHQGGYTREWRRPFTIALVAGVALGIWFAFFMEYTVANKHLAGFPIPTQISSHEKPGDPWVKSTMPVSIRIGGMLANLLCGEALCLLPLAAAAFLKENRTHPHTPTQPRVDNPS